MMMHSRNPRSLVDPRGSRGLAYILGIRDVQVNPDEVDLTNIQPTIDMSMCGYARMNDYNRLIGCEETGSSIAGLQTKTWRVLSVGNAVGADQQIVVPVGYNFLSWGIKVYLQTNAAGAAAMNGKFMACEFEMGVPLGYTITKYHGNFYCNSAVELYAPGGGPYCSGRLTRESICIVPSGCYMQLTWWLQDGTNFPANTNVVYKWCGVAYPEGSPIPMGI